MPPKPQKIQGLTRNEVAVLSVIIAGLVAYIGYVLLFGSGPKEPTGPTREVIVNSADQPGRGDAELSSQVRRNSKEWLLDKQEELAAEPGVPEFEPGVEVYQDDDVRVPFRIMVKRRSEDLLRKDEDKEPELTE